MIRLFILTRSLEVGGAERQVVELAKAVDKDRFSVTVATFYDGGAFRPELECTEGVSVLSLHKRGRWDVFPFVWQLWKEVRRIRPHVIYGNMGVSSELGLVVGRTVRAKAIWALQASNVDFSSYPPISRWMFRLGALLSRFPDLIVTNSYAGKDHHVRQGYSPRRMIVIPQGVNTDRFGPDPEARTRVRDEWHVPGDELLIGLAGRLDPMKDHPTFLRAAALVAEHRAGVRFVCIGDGPAAYKGELRVLASRLGLDDKLVWAGARLDMPAVYNALDIACSTSSYGEGLPNAVAEAMACGVPCVVTNVGDSARLVGNPAQVASPRDPQAVAAALERLVKMATEERAALVKQSRERIMSEYTVQQFAKRTEEALLRILRCTG